MFMQTVLLVSLLSGTSDACSYENDWSYISNIKDDRERYIRTLKDLDSALKKENKIFVSGMIFFPIKLNCRGNEKEINESEFASCYNNVFSKKFLRSLYVDGCLDIHISRNGVRIGKSGEIWMQDIATQNGYSLLITTINN